MTIVEFRKSFFNLEKNAATHGYSAMITMEPEVHLEQSGGYTTVVLQFANGRNPEMNRMWHLMEDYGKEQAALSPDADEIPVMSITVVPMLLGGQYGMVAHDPIFIIFNRQMQWFPWNTVINCALFLNRNLLHFFVMILLFQQMSWKQSNVSWRQNRWQRMPEKRCSRKKNRSNRPEKRRWKNTGSRNGRNVMVLPHQICQAKPSVIPRGFGNNQTEDRLVHTRRSFLFYRKLRPMIQKKSAPRGCALGARVDGCRSNRASARECARAHSFL